jgi:uncharacterized protein YbjT (DUF2867 family)
MILLTGATGTVGRLTARQLEAKGVAFRVMARDPVAARALLGDWPEILAGDFSDPASMALAFAGVTCLSLLCAPVEDLTALELNAVEAARHAGIARIVKMSAIDAKPDAETAIRRWHGVVERRIKDEGFAFTHLWPNAFMQNFRRFAPLIKRDGVFYAPLGDARISLVDAHDVAAVTVAALTDESHAGKTYEITGPAALSYGECAATLSDVLDRPVRYESAPPEEGRAALIEAGLPAWLADALTELDALLREGFGAPVTDVVAQTTGHAPRTFADFARKNAALFR